MTSPATESAPKKSLRAALAGAGGAIGGYLLASYAGVSLWVPGVSALVLFLVFKKTRLGPKRFRGAVAVTGGHLIWFVVGSLALGSWASTLPDILLLLVGVMGVWLRPSLGTALLLGVFQVLSLGLNVTTLAAHTVGSAGHRALLVHCVFRSLAISALAAGYLALRREGAAAANPPMPVQPGAS